MQMTESFLHVHTVNCTGLLINSRFNSGWSIPSAKQSCLVLARAKSLNLVKVILRNNRFG